MTTVLLKRSTYVHILIPTLLYITISLTNEFNWKAKNCYIYIHTYKTKTQNKNIKNKKKLIADH